MDRHDVVTALAICLVVAWVAMCRCPADSKPGVWFARCVLVRLVNRLAYETVTTHLITCVRLYTHTLQAEGAVGAAEMNSFKPRAAAKVCACCMRVHVLVK